MGIEQSKVSCMLLPAQSGKTRKITEYIEFWRDIKMFAGIDKWEDKNEEKIEQEEDDNFFNIIICSNNSLLVQQTQKRMTDDLFSNSFTVHDDEKKEVVSSSNDESCDVYSWLSKDPKARTVQDVAFRICENELKMLVCCAHGTRIERYLYPLLEKLQGVFLKRSFTKKINIFIDEADASINLWSKYENILDLDVINKVTLVSATMDSVIKKYKKISVIPFEETHPDCYVKLKDSEFIIHDKKKESAVGYIKSVVNEFDLIDEMKPGYCLFAPGNVGVDSHNSIKSFFTTRLPCAVVVLNGKEKKMYIPNERPIDLSKDIDLKNPEEIGKLIARKYKEFNIEKRFPFVVTGQLCLGRGITFQSQNFLFTASIIPHISNRASLYQCATRVAGNIKNFQKEQHVIYCSSKTKQVLLEMENCAINVAKILFQKNETEVDKNMMKIIAKPESHFGSTPIIIIDITDDEKKAFKNATKMLDILKKHNEEVYEKIKLFECHCWKIDSREKEIKYGLDSMLKPNAVSSSTNIYSKDKNKNILMFYLFENKLIVSAWNGDKN